MYKEKYLKYKTKYLALKNQLGGGQGPGPHINARSQDNKAYPQRFNVLDEQVVWSYEWPEYDPPDFTHQIVLNNARDLETGQKWADPKEVTSMRDELNARVTYSIGGKKTLGQVIEFSTDGRPLNCMGRTGLKGRGLLGKWGPNQAADPIVTRYHPTTGILQMVAIQRIDTSQWAIPGGMVDAGENVSLTVKREFTEEAGHIQNHEEKLAFDTMIEELFKNGREVYRGYVDDPRNTDNAWMETTAFHFHCSPEIAMRLPLEAGDDAAKVMWTNITTDMQLYASHRNMVFDAIRKTGLPLSINPTEKKAYYQDNKHYNGGYWNHERNNMYWYYNDDNFEGFWNKYGWVR